MITSVINEKGNDDNIIVSIIKMKDNNEIIRIKICM